MKRCLACEAVFDSDAWLCPQCGWTPRGSGPFRLFAPEQASGREGFAPEFFADLFELESGNFWFVARNRLVLWAVARYFGSARRALEVGCGTGFVLSALARAVPGARLTASEVLTDGLARAAARVPSAEFIQMDARAIPYDSEFDLIGAFDVLEHVDDDEQVLREMHRAALPGGGLLLTVPQHPGLWSAADEYALHKRRYTRGDLVAKVQRAGFQVMRVTSFVTLLAPMLLVSRRLHRSLSEFDPLAEYRISRAANSALGAVMSLERTIIRAGASLPFGGSLLMVAAREP
jgi:ubiquinone/menaquinone biosynthesis C-methylase UbiE